MFKILQAVTMLVTHWERLLHSALIFEVCRIHFIVIACDGFDGLLITRINILVFPFMVNYLRIGSTRIPYKETAS